MAKGVGTATPPSVRLALGGALVIVGVGLLLARIIDPRPRSWVLFVLLPGAIVLALGLATSERAGLMLTMAGCVIASKGLLLFWSTATGHWLIWAYGWPLVFPGSVGVGILARGLLRSDPEVTGIGGRLTFAGLGLSALLFLVFEGMVFNRLGGLVGLLVPLLLLGAGVVLVVRSRRS